MDKLCSFWRKISAMCVLESPYSNCLKKIRANIRSWTKLTRNRCYRHCHHHAHVIEWFSTSNDIHTLDHVFMLNLCHDSSTVFLRFFYYCQWMLLTNIEFEKKKRNNIKATNTPMETEYTANEAHSIGISAICKNYKFKKYIFLKIANKSDEQMSKTDGSAMTSTNNVCARKTCAMLFCSLLYLYKCVTFSMSRMCAINHKSK